MSRIAVFPKEKLNRWKCAWAGLNMNVGIINRVVGKMTKRIEKDTDVKVCNSTIGIIMYNLEIMNFRDCLIFPPSSNEKCLKIVFNDSFLWNIALKLHFFIFSFFFFMIAANKRVKSIMKVQKRDKIKKFIEKTDESVWKATLPYIQIINGFEYN